MMKDNEIEGLYLHYDGPFNIQIISTLARFLLENVPGPADMQKKMYKVFIELAQNVSLYSFQRAPVINGSVVGVGSVYVANHEQGFKCVTINRIQPEHAPILIKNCTEINAASTQALKEKKTNLRKIY